ADLGVRRPIGPQRPIEPVRTLLARSTTSRACDSPFRAVRPARFCRAPRDRTSPLAETFCRDRPVHLDGTRLLRPANLLGIRCSTARKSPALRPAAWPISTTRPIRKALYPPPDIWDRF